MHRYSFEYTEHSVCYAKFSWIVTFSRLVYYMHSSLYCKYRDKYLRT